MHILFIGYGKTSARVAKQLFQAGHQITTISRSRKSDVHATHLIQDVQQLDLSQLAPIDWVYVLLSPGQSTPEAYQHTYLDSVAPIVTALAAHPVRRMVVVSSTRVYGQNAGEWIEDTTPLQPPDIQADILLKMEQAYLSAYPERCTIIRPSGIYGTSIARMVKLAHTLTEYPNRHWSNRIHIDDLARFLAQMIHVEHLQESYIVSNGQPQLLHEVVQWFQQQLHRPLLTLTSPHETGKRIRPKRMQDSGFKLQHDDCFQDYLALLQQADVN